jgi:hypothetical protein
MIKKLALLPQRSSEISEEEKTAAKNVLKIFKKFLHKLWAARQHDERLINVLEKNENADPSSLFEIRHLLRRFQKEAKDQYTDLIFMFAGKKDDNMELIEKGVIHLLAPLEKDTTTRQIKMALQDAMQQLSEFTEEFLEAFEDFNSKDQIKSIVEISKKSEKIIQSVENIIEKQLKPHFEKNILGPKKVGSIRGRIRRRARLISLLEA